METTEFEGTLSKIKVQVLQEAAENIDFWHHIWRACGGRKKTLWDWNEYPYKRNGNDESWLSYCTLSWKDRWLLLSLLGATGTSLASENNQALLSTSVMQGNKEQEDKRNKTS